MRLDMPTIYTKRCRLRPVELEDCTDMYAYYKDATLMKYVRGKPHKSIEETLQFLNNWELAYEKRGVPQTWVIELLKEEKVIGHLNFHTIEEGIGEIGYMLHAAYWSQGIMKESLLELLRIGMNYLRLHRIEAKCAVENTRSLKVLSACGFYREGILRKYTKLQGDNYHDMVLFSVVSEES